jgi:hypothetical protein
MKRHEENLRQPRSVNELYILKHGKRTLSFESYNFAEKWAERRAVFELHSHGLLSRLVELYEGHDQSPPQAILRDVTAMALTQPERISLDELRQVRTRAGNIGVAVHKLMNVGVLTRQTSSSDAHPEFQPSRLAVMTAIDNADQIGFLTSAAERIDPNFRVINLLGSLSLEDQQTLDTSPLPLSGNL